MVIQINEQGITALRALVARMQQGVEDFQFVASNLAYAWQKNRQGIGPHSMAVEALLGELQRELQGARAPVAELSEKVLAVAQAYQEFVELDRFSGDGPADGAASSSRAGGTQFEGPLAGVKRIAGQHTAAADMAATNPGYASDSTGGPYHVNCQRCVPAFEARRRGYDVTAKPKPVMDDLSAGRGWTAMYRDAQPIPCAGNGYQDTVSRMQGWGEGARAEVKVVWDGGYSGHVFVAEVVAGNVVFLDPQNGDTDCAGYFSDVEPGSVEVLRTDNLEFSDRIRDCIKEV